MAEQAERDRDRKQGVAFPPLVAQRQYEGEARERQRRGGEQLAVVPRRRIGGHESGQLVGEPGDHRAGPGHVQAPQQPIGEKTREDVVQHEVEVHDRRDWEDEAQERRRVEDVPVACGDERQPAEQFGVPERHVPQAVPPLGAPGAKRITGRVLVAARGSQPLSL